MSINVIVAGGTGAVGARLLHHLAADARVGRVTAVGRRRIEDAPDKVTSAVCDLSNESGVSLVLPSDAAVAFSCLGTTIKKAGSPKAFRAVDKHAVLHVARAARSKGVERFVLVSSIGANPKSRNLYLRTKGEVEDDLAGMGFRQVIITRPSFLDDEGTRSDHRLGEQLALPVARALFAVIGKTHRYAPISVDAVARALVALAFASIDGGGAGRRDVESDELHRLASPTP